MSMLEHSGNTFVLIVAAQEGKKPKFEAFIRRLLTFNQELRIHYIFYLTLPIVTFTTMYCVNDSDDNDVLHCPYNKSHRISKSRFQRHLVKCEKNFPPDYKVICPYNATHRLSKSEIEEHINTCPMRRTVEGSYIRPSSPRATIRSKQNDDSTSQVDYNSYWGSQEM